MHYPSNHRIARKRSIPWRVARVTRWGARYGIVVPAVIVSESITFTDTLTVLDDNNIHDTLTFAETLDDSTYVDDADAISFDDVISVNDTINRSFADVIAFEDSIIVLPNGTESTCDEAYVPSPPLSTASQVVLTFPYVSPSETLVIRNPKFGNSNTLVTNTRYQRTRSGQLGVVRPSSWPTIKTFKVAFSALTEAQADSFKQFIEDSAALEIGYLDQEARQWRGFIVNQVLTSMPVGIGCQYNLDFEFRGRLA